MTAPAGNLLRSLADGEATIETPSLSGEGFRLVPSSTRIFIPSGAPVILYDVLTPDSSARVGIASLILEADPEKVASQGNVCANIAESHPDQALQAKAGEALLRHGFDRGLITPLIVVPTSHEPSMRNAASLSPSRTTAVESRGVVVFEYRRPE